MFFPSELDENTTILIEAETSAAFAKSDMEERPDPRSAFLNAVALAAKLSSAVSDGFGTSIQGQGASGTATFGVRIASSGAVMLSQTLDRAQIQVAIRFGT